MHEEALVRDLRRKLQEISADHGSRPIVRARVSLGPLAHLDERRFRELWPRAMAGGPAARADLVVETPTGLGDPEAASIVLRSVTFDEPGPSGRPRDRATDPPPTSSPGGP